jgi:hypothetical protein
VAQMTRIQNRVSRDSFREMKFFAMKSGFDCPARPSSIFAPIDVPESSSFMLSRLTTGPRSCNRTQSLDTSHANRKALSHRSWLSIMSACFCTLYAAAKPRSLFVFVLRFSVQMSDFLLALRNLARTAGFTAHCLAGVAVGGMLAIGLSQLLSSRLHNLGQLDFVTLLIVSIAFLASATFAAWLPARRATRIDPIQALRFD